MPKHMHEIRDPIHIFIRLDSGELKVLNSRPFQRLRHIHQLALTYLVYPGATHRRFEHCLGVMELAGRVYDIVTASANLLFDSVRSVVPQSPYEREYWRRVVRMAALCHDIGHLPFSHGAEDLLPQGWSHELLTLELIHCNEMQSIWKEIKIQADDVARLAIGPNKYNKKYPGTVFNSWESILSEIIVSDAFGVDRMDYLLRDSHHAGVAYGKFDHYRLIDTLRILPQDAEGSTGPALGIDDGGMYSAEALLLARYFMYTQVYFHPVRRIYDIHLKDFLKNWLPGGCFPIEVADHLDLTDNEVTTGMLKVAKDQGHPGYEAARRIINRKHFKLLYKPNPNDVAKNPECSKAVFAAACNQFGKAMVRHDPYTQKGSGLNFPVLTGDDTIVSSLAMSETLKRIPVIAVDYVFVTPEHRDDAKKWLNVNRDAIIAPTKEEES